jgi:lipopolysaccharide export LptBFGC system permease protein LptF
MSWTDILCLVLVILGVALFLYGANAYDAVSGYGGIGLFVLGIVLYAVLQILGASKKKENLEPVKA